MHEHHQRTQERPSEPALCQMITNRARRQIAPIEHLRCNPLARKLLSDLRLAMGLRRKQVTRTPCQVPCAGERRKCTSNSGTAALPEGDVP